MNGQKEAIRLELAALLPRLRRFARGMARDADLADDLVQDACERALAAFKDREAVPEDVKVLFWETGYGVRDIDVKY